MRRLSVMLANARARGALYVRLLGWLFALACGRFPLPILTSAAAAVAGVACHGLALGILAETVTRVQVDGTLSAFPGLARLGLHLPAPPLAVVIGLFVLTFVCGSVLGYSGRSLAIRLDSALYKHLAEWLLERLSPQRPGPAELLCVLRNRHVLGRKHELQSVLLRDSRFAGTIVRLGLFNIIHLGNLLIGLLVVVFYAPMLLALIAVFGVLAVAAMYPLNLVATRTTRHLELHGPRRAAYIRTRLGLAPGRVGTAEGSAFEAASEDFDEFEPLPTELGEAGPAALDEFLLLSESRLRIIELSRVVMSSMAAAGIGALVWLLFVGHHVEIASPSALLVLLFGLRFVLNGIEGMMITATSINRFLPNLLRLHDLMRDVTTQPAPREPPLAAAFGVPSGSLTAAPGARAPDDPLPRITWRVDTADLQAISGEFVRGRIYGIVGPAATLPEVCRQVQAICVDGAAALGDALHDFRATVGQRPADADLLAQDADAAAWVAEVVTVGDLPIDAATVAAVVAGRSPLSKQDTALVRFLLGIRYLSGCPGPVALIDGTMLCIMNHAGIRRVYAAFPGRLLFMYEDRGKRALDNCLGELVLVSDGRRIVCAVPLARRNPLSELLVDAIVNGEWSASEAAAGGAAAVPA